MEIVGEQSGMADGHGGEGQEDKGTGMRGQETRFRGSRVGMLDGYKLDGGRRTFPSVSRLVALREGKLRRLNGPFNILTSPRADLYSRFRYTLSVSRFIALREDLYSRFKAPKCQLVGY
jgi:hypothetical protein